MQLQAYTCDSHLLYRHVGVDVRIPCVNLTLLCWHGVKCPFLFPDMHASLKAKGLSVNFGNVTTSRDVNLTIDVRLSTMSEFWWFDQ